jgi:zinc transport system substrate-binding protein
MLRFISSIFISSTLIFVFISNALALDKLPVFVSIAPQKYFVQQIGKDLVDVRVMVPPGADPHTYAPKPKQMVAISKTKLYFTIGIEFEKANLNKIISSNPHITVVHTDQGIQKIPMKAHDHNEHEDQAKHGHHKKSDHHVEDDHAPGDDQHDHNGLDPHIWLSPTLVKMQARTILDALLDADPTHRSDYEANYEGFIAELEKVDADLKKTFAGRHGMRFMVFHPSWGYFARSYGLEQVAVEMEGKDPKPAQLKALIEHARWDGINVVFVQPQFSAKSARLVAKEIGGEVAFVDPLAENWAANLREVADRFKAALK